MRSSSLPGRGTISFWRSLIVNSTASRPMPREAWAATEEAWSGVAPGCEDLIAVSDARHAYAVLHGLTSASGAMVAAATTSLPERLEGSRNYDYRYAWIRDQCYAGLAVAAHGPHPLLAGAVRFVAGRLLDDGPELMPAYTVAGEPVGDEGGLRLRGFPGGSARAGNRVRGQFQLDAVGESLSLFAAAARHDMLPTDDWRAAASRRRRDREAVAEPNAGIWELDDKRWTHSRLACVSGLRAIAAAAAAGPPGGTGQREAARWSSLADVIAASLATPCTRAAGGSAHRTTRGWTRPCCFPSSGAGSPATTRGTWRPSRRCGGNWRPTGSSTGSGTMTGRCTRPRGRSCSAGSGWPRSSTPAATRSRRRTGSSGTGAPAGRLRSTPRSTTCTSGS